MIIDSHVHVYPPSFRERREELARRDATFRALYADPRAVLATADDLLAARRGGCRRCRCRCRGHRVDGPRRCTRGQRLPGRVHGPQRWASACLRIGEPGVGRRRPGRGGAMRHRGARRRRGAAPGHAGLQHRRRVRDGAADGAGEAAGHAGADARIGARGPQLPRQRNGHAGPADALHRVVPWAAGHRRALGRRAPLLRAHAGGQGRPRRRLLRHCGVAVPLHADVFPSATRIVGAERVLFGTDFPLIKHARLLAQVRESGLSDEEQALITGGNAAKLLGLGG